MRRFVPHPLLTLLVAAVWVLLNNEISAGQIVLGLAFGLVVPKMTSAYWPGRPSIRSPLTIAEYIAIVLWDIVVSNCQVAYLILFRRGASLDSRFVTVPLDLRTPEAITVLAGTVTMTPGTVSADLSADGRALLIHCLDTGSPESVVAQVKDRYERRLARIFE